MKVCFLDNAYDPFMPSGTIFVEAFRRQNASCVRTQMPMHSDPSALHASPRGEVRFIGGDARQGGATPLPRKSVEGFGTAGSSGGPFRLRARAGAVRKNAFGTDGNTRAK